jgi:hypothetical protein
MAVHEGGDSEISAVAALRAEWMGTGSMKRMEFFESDVN